MKIATCNGCGAYVMLAEAEGCKIVVDPVPLDADGFRARLLAGLHVAERHGQTIKLRTPSSRWPPRGDLLGEHPCRRNATPVELVVPPKGTPAPNTSASAPMSRARTGRAPAKTATRRRSDIWRCENCRKLIEPWELRWSIEVGIRRWALHDTCPNPLASS